MLYGKIPFYGFAYLTREKKSDASYKTLCDFLFMLNRWCCIETCMGPWSTEQLQRRAELCCLRRRKKLALERRWLQSWLFTLHLSTWWDYRISKSLHLRPIFNSFYSFTSLSEPLSCGSPDSLQNTTVSGRNFTNGSNISYSCPIGHALIGNETRKCDNGVWSGKAPTCKCKSISNVVCCGKWKLFEHLL